VVPRKMAMMGIAAQANTTSRKTNLNFDSSMPIYDSAPPPAV
jgi:hypothetical protein